MRSTLLLLLFCACFAAPLASQTPAPDLELHGEIQPSENQTFVTAPFQVPQGTHRITVAFHNLGKAQHTTLDLGIADPFRFRGASGGNKDRFTLSDTDATPSYLPGAIPPGEWKLLIIVPNIRPNVTSQWRAEVWFNRPIDDDSFTESPLNDQPGWYRGDLHMHTAHSDGSCANQTGKPVPCPVFLTAEAATKRGLDFIAITDHNTTSHDDAERELQPYFDKLLLIPGREMTTFYGHANVFGTTRFIDYGEIDRRTRDANEIFSSAHDLGALVSINHPLAPTGEICMGCGWTPRSPVDMRLVNSIEVINGGGAPATSFWEQQLRQGLRITAVGGSDNHHADWPADKPGSVGYPTTVVHAANLSVAAILDGIRKGHVFLDVSGSRNRALEFTGRSAAGSVEMGDDLEPKPGESIALTLHISGCAGANAEFFVDGQASSNLPALPVSTANQVFHANWSADGARHWLRVEVHDSAGHLLLFGNPIYAGFEHDTTH